MASAFDHYQKAGLQHGAKVPEPEVPLPPQEPFEDLLKDLINRTSQENDSGTPDYILSKFLTRVLDVYNETIQARAEWRNEPIDKIFNVKYNKLLVSVYDEHGKRNDIGTAEVEVWPGETLRYGRMVGLVPIFTSLPPSGFEEKDEEKKDA